jgi:DNA-binding MarR family transcriptional regulator
LDVSIVNEDGEDVKGLSPNDPNEGSDEVERQFVVRDARDRDRFFVDNLLIDTAGQTEVTFTWRGREVKEKLGPIAIAVYTALARHAGYEDQRCWPSQRLIAQELGIAHTDTVQRALLKLEALNLIRGERRDRKVTIWTLLDKSCWRITCPTKEGSPESSIKGASPSYPIEQGRLPHSMGQATLLNRDEHNLRTELKNETHHGDAPASHDVPLDTGPSAMKSYDDSRRSGLREMLRDIGHDYPDKLIAKALEAGWSEGELAQLIGAVGRTDGRIRNKAAFLTDLLSKEPDQARSILRSYTDDSGTAQNIESVKRRYKNVLVEWGELQGFVQEDPHREDFRQRLTELKMEGQALAAELRGAGVDPERLKAEVFHDQVQA